MPWYWWLGMYWLINAVWVVYLLATAPVVIEIEREDGSDGTE